MKKRSAINVIRKLGLTAVIILGLFTIIGTGDDSDDDNSSGGTTTTNSNPTATITMPEDASTFTEGSTVVLAGTATDTEDGTLKGASLEWSSTDTDYLGSGASIKAKFPVGEHKIFLTATDGEGGLDAKSVTITVSKSKRTPPEVTINSPATGSSHALGDEIYFNGGATDSEDGNLDGSSLIWATSKGGILGYGQTVQKNDLSGGKQTITLTATDSDGDTTVASVDITIENTLPTAKITWPADGEIFPTGDRPLFTGTGTDTEDGTMTGDSLEWYYNGIYFGSGNSAQLPELAAGTYRIVLMVEDSAKEIDVDSIEITVQ